LSTRQADGATKREHLQAAQRALGRALPELQGDPLPDAVVYLWRWFIDLNNARTAHSPISFSELQAWAQLKRLQLDPLEVEAIKALDGVYLNLARKAQP